MYDARKEGCGKVVVTDMGYQGYLVEAAHEDRRLCNDGMWLPLFPGEAMWHPAIRIPLYGAFLAWCFLGVAIISDIFMSAIEVITSKKRKIVMKDSMGRKHEIDVLVWNETIANLSLMALGSSAPEILLAVIETCSNLGENIPAEGGLGPGTIVGSAAFNLLAITGICVICIPNGEVRKVQETGVFLVTSFFSVFAYLWLIVILKVSTPDEIDLWEALLTLFFFPALLILAYCQDNAWFRKRSGDSRRKSQMWVAGTGGMGSDGYGRHENIAALLKRQRRMAMVEKIHDIDQDAFSKYCAEELMSKQPKSRMQYRINAMRGLSGARRVIPGMGGTSVEPGNFFQKGLDSKDAPAATASHGSESKEEMETTGAVDGPSPETLASLGAGHSVFNFSTTSYSIFENEAKIEVPVIRSGDTSKPASVKFETSNGTAEAGKDYIYTCGKLDFVAGETRKDVVVPIIDDNEWEPDENFYIRLTAPGGDDVSLGHINVADVTIINDDKPGDFGFERTTYSVKETDGHVEMKIVRTQGCDGTVRVKFKTYEGTAKAGISFEATEETFVFDHSEMQKFVKVPIINEDKYDKQETFSVEIEIVGYPDNGTGYSACKNATVTISNDEDFTAIVDALAESMDESIEQMSIGSKTWKQNFKEAMNCTGDGGEPSMMDYAMHFLSFFWKVLFAIVPPTRYLSGWLTFVCSLIFIGILTGFIGDLASLFGCMIGIPDAITAITLVALGTSLPDTFASKAAAIGDENADASIGNVTGSNAVNVFLGLGLPWTIAAGFYLIRDGDPYRLPAGSLAFSVTIFVCCATIALSTLVLRKLPCCGGAALGAPKGKAWIKWVVGILFFSLWIFYIVMSILNNYEVIPSF